MQTKSDKDNFRPEIINERHFHQACLPAAKLALEDVNKNQDILGDYHINLADKDDEVNSEVYKWDFKSFCSV